MLANLGDQEIEIVLVLGLWEISKHNPISKVPEGTLLTLTLGTFNCVTREVKDALGVTVSINGLEYGHIETFEGSSTMAGHRIGVWLKDPTVSVTAVTMEPTTRSRKGYAIRVVKTSII